MTVAGSPESARGGVPVAVARQPILDRAEQVRGYELLYRPAGAAALGPEGATSNVIVRALADIGLDALVGEHEGLAQPHARVPARGVLAWVEQSAPHLA